MIYLYALFIIVFYCTEFIWIISGFFGAEMSLTVMWTPLAGTVIIAHFFRLLMRHKLNYSAKSFVKIQLAALIIITISFILNYKEKILPIDYHAYSYIIPFILILLSLLTLSTRFTKKEIYFLQRILIGVFFVNIIVSLSQIFLLVFDFINIEFFYRNIRYTVIGFLLNGKLLIRIPGIFESGATNAFFTASICLMILSHFQFRKRRSLFLNLMFYLGIIVLVSTLTRRYIISFTIIVYIYYLLLSIKEKKKYFFSRIIGLPIFIIIIYISYIYFNDFYQTKSLHDRFYYWKNNLNTIINSDYHLFYGFGYLQVVIKKIKSFSFHGDFPLEIMDNMYLSWLMFGGIFFLTAMLLYLLTVSFFSLKCFLTSSNSSVEEFSLIIFLNSIFVLIAGMFGTFWDNVQESFIFWYAQPAMISYILIYSSNRKKRPVQFSPIINSKSTPSL